jgi:hypothetical protein
VDRQAVEDWIRAHVEPVGAVEVTHERPWSTVIRVPVAGGSVWFKACSDVQTFEPRLSAELSARWSDRVAEVLAHDEERAWLLLADAGTPIGVYGSPPDAWLEALPPYAELQRGETAYADDHLAHSVPDLRIATLPARYEDFLRHELPIDEDEIRRLRDFQPRFAELCAELAGLGIPESVQHDDLHLANVYLHDGQMRVLDWGDSSIAHPFFSLVVTFRFLDEINHLAPNDPWFTRLRDAYLEPWGSGLTEVFELALRVGALAHAIAWARQRDYLPESERPEFDRPYRLVLQRAVARADAQTA